MGTSKVILKKVKPTDLIGTLQIQFFNGKGTKKQISLSLKISEENYKKFYDDEFKQFRKTTLFDYSNYNTIIREKINESPFNIVKSDTTYLLKYIKKRSLLIGNLNTRNGYNVVHNHLQKFIIEKKGLEEDIELNNVNIDFLIEFKNYLTSNDISNSTILNYFIILKGILNNSSSEDLYNVNLKFLFKKLNLKTTTKIKPTLSNQDVLKLLSATKEYKFYDYIQIGLLQLFGMGMRQSDVFLLKFENFNKEGISYTTKKNKKSLPIPYDDEILLTTIFNILDLDKPTKVIYSSNENAFTQTISNIKGFQNYQKLDADNYRIQLIELLLNHINKLPKKNLLLRKIVNSEDLESYSKNMDMNENQLRKYKLVCVKYNQILKYIQRDFKLDIENLSSHSFRYSYTKFMLEEGFGIYEISQNLSHSSVAITENYINRGFDINKIKGVNSKTFSRFNRPDKNK